MIHVDYESKEIEISERLFLLILMFAAIGVSSTVGLVGDMIMRLIP